MAELDEVFRDVACAHLKEFVPGNECPDQYVADLGQTPLTFDRQSTDEAPSAIAPVILILESPHFLEYGDRANPVPACGRTGEGIRHHLHRALALLEGAALDGRPLILANAIQYQCSLAGSEKPGIAPKFHRDGVFERMWNHTSNAARIHFGSRLKKYVGTHPPFSPSHLEGYVVINACTKGKLKRELRCMVEDEVRVALPCKSHVTVEHPCNWKPRTELRPWTYDAD
ncbi:hypothetical protein [Stigmatella aurantiaca]|uniref:hypothetical protein n=1 Tax=Stigmatella aurantiaca TaxID=41 RepID=UPI0011D2087E|nr:hypothetical protein [Stigmatella aurantiaca]